MKKVFSLFIVNLVVAASLSAALSNSGSKSSLMKVTLPQIVVKLASIISNKFEKADLFYDLRQADRQQGMDGTMHFLFNTIENKTSKWSKISDQSTLDKAISKTDWFSIATESIFLGLMCKLIEYDNPRDKDRYDSLEEDIDLMKDVLLDYLQSVANDTVSTSPRGSQSDISYTKKKKKNLDFQFDDVQSVIRKELDFVLVECLCS
ncbi:hypothetical protein COB28_01910 [Candidatus Dependentiae bacterium]|nr:MAG: hypothetical protein COB28_01910 [Candidatus Dependentiae bacterium]